ncbi:MULTISPECIES: sirohydrochlorin cobaltochelatase [unclassified Lentimonas]|uniref:sirohydrochlorin cobaltochelatase n=1 Tax=unclassified Lentimonas TaxID=2630993 RepID=UPI0013284BAF|nr:MULTISPECIES: sirohydrochlorin cobaltochelatase [unclassified Lentimonas]CAA6691570.1 Sirohydrochlorin cobaltochelatase CbiK (EC / Sirohydrochlorin ferrochelatase (EC [Lentimonas sp. CC10]CAA6696235.1 Sirohydrochlorin cobaltochelatase CbiK (EC / Sirohydrochlorin ferrochelatase (EC [Lentimonas sp. CC19]CAA7070868.1 Sirohydrochlorin cobaltochelatase CbiK (EC / Sirohydrochlorin ferrochelatase (EC [Lentimonas sp. CC11]
MKSVILIPLLILLVQCLAATPHKTTPPQEFGILLASFGTSDPAGRAAYAKIEDTVRERWPNSPIYWAYTSDFIRAKSLRNGVELDSPSVALSKMSDAGIKRVVVQSLHIIAGQEYEEITYAIHAYQGSHRAFDSVEIGMPLLASNADVLACSQLMITEADTIRKTGSALLFMGHGSRHHPADLTYTATAAVLRDLDPQAYLATVESPAGFEKILNQFKADQTKSVTLVPFMSVAGDHAKNDLAGDEPDSWKSQLEAAGIECDVLLRGMGEFDGIIDIWIEHLANAVEALDATEHES